MRPASWTTISLALPLALACGTAAGCASPGGGTEASAKAQAPVAPTVPYPGSVRERSVSQLPSGRDFDFGGGRRVAGGRLPEPDAPAEAASAADAAEPGRSAAAPVAPGEFPAPARREDLAAVAPHGVRITWEALAVERELAENPRLGRRPQQGAVPDLKTVLVSDDHPAARGRQKGRAATRERDGTQVAVVDAEEMRLLVRGLREAGFFQVSRPTDAIAPRFADPEARGRVTIEFDGRTNTVLSMRGQGTQAATRDVPRIYSQAKQAVAAVRNRTPTLNVVTTGREPVRVAPRRGSGEHRTLTEEEAAEVLGTDLPPKPVDDTWGLGR